MYNIGILPLNGFALMSYASLVEPFRAANFLSEKKYYNVINFSESKEGTVSSSDLKISGDYHIGDTPELDIFFVKASCRVLLKFRTFSFNSMFLSVLSSNTKKTFS